MLIVDDSCGTKRFAIQKHLLVSLNRGLGTVYLKQNCLLKANLGKTLSSRKCTLFFSNLPVTWCKAVRLVHKWDYDQSPLTAIETQHLFPKNNYWLTFRNKQMSDYVNVQKMYLSPQKFTTPNDWIIYSLLRCTQKSLYSPSVPIVFSWVQISILSVLSKRVYPVSLQVHGKSDQRNLQKIKRY